MRNDNNKNRSRKGSNLIDRAYSNRDNSKLVYLLAGEYDMKNNFRTEFQKNVMCIEKIIFKQIQKGIHLKKWCIKLDDRTGGYYSDIVKESVICRIFIKMATSNALEFAWLQQEIVVLLNKSSFASISVYSRCEKFIKIPYSH